MQVVSLCEQFHRHCLNHNVHSNEYLNVFLCHLQEDNNTKTVYKQGLFGHDAGNLVLWDSHIVSAIVRMESFCTRIWWDQLWTKVGI